MDNLNISLNSDFQIDLCSHIEIQGDIPLEMIAIKKNCAEYKIYGFTKPQFYFYDYRKHSLRAIRSCVRSGKFDGFIDQFNKPASLCIKQSDDKNFLVELRDPNQVSPRYMLWVAIGIKETTIPDYHFIVKELVPMKKNKALLSIYVRPNDV